MNESTKHLIEILNANIQKDLPKQLDHFDLLTKSLFKLVQSLYENDEKLEHHQIEIEGKFFRYGLANQSLINLAKGNSFELLNQKVTIGDIFSINSITRMQIEAYLIMFYLFFDKVTIQEKDFRYDIYRIHGLKKQMNFKLSKETKNDKVNLKKIETELDEAITNITKSNIFKNASNKKQQEYLKPQYAKLVKSSDLFKKSNITKSRIDQIWQIYSNHAHSEHIGDRQYNTAYKIRKSVYENLELSITLNSILTSKLLVYLADTFVGASNELKKLPEKEKANINFWSTLNK